MQTLKLISSFPPVHPRSHALRGNAVKARCAASHGQHVEIHIAQIRDAARPAMHSHAARGNESKIVLQSELFQRFGTQSVQHGIPTETVGTIKQQELA